MLERESGTRPRNFIAEEREESGTRPRNFIAEEILLIVTGRVDALDIGIARISVLTVNLMKILQLYKSEMDASILIYKNTNGSNKEDVISAVRQHREVDKLRRMWDAFWKDKFSY